MKIKQFLIAVDQTFNTIVGGWADETLSARTYRNSRDGVKGWTTFRKIIDAIFFWQPHHCYASYVSEQDRTQLPAEYRGEPK